MKVLNYVFIKWTYLVVPLIIEFQSRTSKLKTFKGMFDRVGQTEMNIIVRTF